MSFGFPEERLVNGKKVITQAILKAVADRDTKILFFSAASNSGANGPENFPATHPYVISIRATRPNGAPWDRNPPIGTHREAFGTLGTDVSAAWLRSEPRGKILSGTSVATPIAAGMAAMLLGYAEADAEVDNEIFERLKTKDGMGGLFREISTKYTDGFHYIDPSDFWGADVEDKTRRAMMVTAATRRKR
jgi:subtilisin family serine protease